MNATQLKQHWANVIETLKKTPDLLRDKRWRLENLYVINTKSKGKQIFKLTRAQKHFLDNIRNRNIILKSRQLGFSTLITLWILDETLFKPNKEALAIAHVKEGMTDIFDKKAKFAIMNFPDEIKGIFDFKTNSKTKLTIQFADGSQSTFGVALSGRSGTYQYVHISEYAKLSKMFPQRAEEVMTGTLPAVPMDGFVFIESTAEGASGSYYDTYIDALDAKSRGSEALFKVQFYPHFYNWTWDDMELDGITEIIPVSAMQRGNVDWESYQAQHNLSDKEMTYYYMRWLSLKKDVERLNQEYPTCLIGSTLVNTKDGLIKIRDIIPDGEIIKKKFDQGIKDVYTLTTKNGYSIVGTLDHKIKTTDGSFVELGNMIGKDVLLSGNSFGKDIQSVTYKPKPFIESKITIDKEFSRFLGYFMGDGSIEGSKGTISIACDIQCQDVVDDVEYLLTKYFGKPNKRITGKNGGCLELRVSAKEFIQPFFEMGIMRKNSSGNYKRKICVPGFIKTSPKEIVREFIIGLFEADGFADRNGNRVIFFTKYKDFAQDVQLLLLQFGITCKLNNVVKKSSSGGEYVGHELCLRKQEVIKYNDELGFVSDKKRSRIGIDRPEAKNELKMTMSDTVVSIDFYGTEQVWDIETHNHEFAANGIIVHNCADEAFISTGKPYFDQKKILECKMMVQEPEYFDVIGREVVDVYAGPLMVWKKPQARRAYVIGGDTAEGLHNGDYSTLTVIDVETREIQAIYRSQIPPDEFYEVCIAVGNWYNNALLAVEVNKDGLWVNNELERSGYTNLYYRQRIDDVTKQVANSFGWRTDRQSRDSMLTELRSVFTDVAFVQAPLLDEMISFVRNARGKPEAVLGKHDDVIMSTAIAYMVRKLWYVENFKQQNTQSKPTSKMDLIFMKLNR